MSKQQEVAESILGTIIWDTSTSGFCKCPGEGLHTKKTSRRDCQVFLEDGKPPTVTCFHSSCEAEIMHANNRLRSELGKLHVAGKSISGEQWAPPPKVEPEKPQRIRYKLRKDAKAPIPDEIEDGARRLIRTAFEAGEGIRIVHALLNEDGDEVPTKGLSFTRERWLEMLNDKDGRVNDGRGIFYSEGKPGVYVAMNPIKPGETKDEHITAFRHALLEFDDLPLETQWSIYNDSDLPITAIIHSGRRSLHAWVKVDAKDRAEYDARVAEVYDYFADYKPDTRNKNPGRLSRLPGCLRLDGRQKLLAVGIGKSSFAEWLAARAIEGIGEPLSIDELMEFDPANDPNSVIGKRYLCRGGSMFVVAQSGIGKSTIATQFAVSWALGIPVFGIAPRGPLKSMIIQAENDEGDIAEQFQGAALGMGIDPNEHPSQFDQLRQNVIYIRDSIHAGQSFISTVSRLVDRHKPDLVWIDPLLSFLGGDVSKQDICSKFLRSGLNPIAEATGVIFILIHHTAKPAKDPKSMSNWTMSDFSYLGTGSAEITNWPRAVMTIQQIEDETFILMLAKRGGRAGAVDIEGRPTQRVYIKHSKKGLWWQQTEAPAEAPRARDPKAGVDVDDKPAKGRGYDPSDWLESIRGVPMQYRDLLESALSFAQPRGGPKERRMKSIIAELRAQGILERLEDGTWIFNPTLF